MNTDGDSEQRSQEARTNMKDALSLLLDEYENQLLTLARRQFLVEAFTDDLDKVTRGEEFSIRNGPLWVMLLDTRDMLVVHLASWACGVYQPGGLIDRLQACHAVDLPRERPREGRDDDPSWKDRRDREHADAIVRLFPGLADAHPGSTQFDQLRDTFVARLKPVVDDRSANRVHPFDRDAEVGSVKMIPISELRETITYAERFLNDVNMVGCHQSLGYREMNAPNAADVVPDIVDALLLGPSDQITRLRGTLDRHAFYSELHRRHAALPVAKGLHFNDRLFVVPPVVETSGTRRHVGLFPALPLSRNIALGEWIVGTPPAAISWASVRFRELSETLIRSFETDGFKGGALLWHRDRGFDGSKPTDEDIAAIRAAVTFAVLDANDRLDLSSVDAKWSAGPYLATTENGDLFVQPISDEDGGITHARGGPLKGTFVYGMKIGDKAPPLADAVQPMHRPVRATQTLAGAIFDAVRSGSADGQAVATAAEWHRTALANPQAVTMEQRLIALKTGFEALLHEDDSRKCARLLRELFARSTAAYVDRLPWRGLLWSPTERTDLHRTYRGRSGKVKTDTRSEIEDWFMTLAKARNEIIHEGKLTTRKYTPPPERPLSQYAGHLLWIGERLLREAIKAKLGPEILLCGRLPPRELVKAIGDSLRERQQSAQATLQMHPSSTPVASDDPQRSVPELIAWLGCPSANYVTLKKLHSGVGATMKLAAEMAERRANKWEATVPGKSLLIWPSEYESLKQAGAEDEVPDYRYKCI
jgi:hypothetical protein